MSTTRYVWLNINDGSFSDSWDQEMHDRVNPEKLCDETNDNWKLIKYECLNDNDFEFNNHM